MRPDRKNALKMRLQGKSYGEIRSALGVPKSTLSVWLSGVVISKDLRERIDRRAYKKSVEGLIRRNRGQTAIAQKRALDIRSESMKEIAPVSKSNLLLLGAALYWAEGYKRLLTRNGRELTSHAVALTNSDPLLVRTFLRFLREYCEVPESKIKASIRIFKHQNEAELFSFWQNETKILKENFRKTYSGISRSRMGKRPFNRLPYGVIQILVADTRLFHRIMGHIEGIKKFV